MSERNRVTEIVTVCSYDQCKKQREREEVEEEKGRNGERTDEEEADILNTGPDQKCGPPTYCSNAPSKSQSQ